MATDVEMRDKYREAERLILEGQSAQWGDHMLTLADLQKVRDGRLEYERRVATAERYAAGDRSPARYRLASFHR